MAGDDLEDHNAEAEDVGLGGEVAVHEVLGRHVPVGAGDAGVDAGAAVAGLWEETGHAEVGDLGHPPVVEEDVAGLDVAMDDGRVRVLVEVQQAPRHAHHHLVPPRPGQLRAPQPVAVAAGWALHDNKTEPCQSHIQGTNAIKNSNQKPQ